MSWSIFREGGGEQAAVWWARDMLTELGAVLNASTLTFVYQWQVSEGAGGRWNPLNQGPVPNHPEWTSTGQQYGGGAADFVSREAGIHGAVAYLKMGNYAAILSALRRGDGNAARHALIASPWAASHYGNGAHFSNSPLPHGEDWLDMASIDEVKQAVRDVLNEGTAAGQQNWASTSKAILGRLGDVVNLLNRLIAKTGA